MTGFLRRFLLVLVSLALLEGYGCSASPSTPTGPVIVTDQLVRTVTFDKPPQRIVSLAPSNTEILYALRLADRVVGVTDYDDYPPEVKQKQSVGGFSTPSLEKVVSLSPDVVVAASIHQKEVIPQLEASGLTVLALAPKTIDDVMAAITMVGMVTGTTQKASGIVAGLRKRVKAITDGTDELSADKRPKVMYIVWHDPLRVAGAGTFLDELISKAGGVNVFGGLKDYPTVGLEMVIQANPDVVLAGVGMGQGSDAPLTFAKTDPRLSDIAARQNERVCSIDSTIAGRTGPRIVDVLEEFARLIHPELFK